PDGRMDVTWKLKETKWQDGQPFVASDLILGFKVMTDLDVPTTKATWPKLVDSFESPDPHTLIMHWNAPYFLAGGSGTTGAPAPGARTVQCLSSPQRIARACAMPFRVGLRSPR